MTIRMLMATAALSVIVAGPLFAAESATPPKVSFTKSNGNEAMDGRAICKQINAKVECPQGGFSFHITAFIPRGDGPMPAFLLVNDRSADAADPDRKAKSGFWPAEEIVERGYAAVVMSTNDIAVDRLCAVAGWDNMPAEFRKACGEGGGDAPSVVREWAWAWAASRVLDWIASEPTLDASRVAVVGSSRGGMAALWAGVADSRFALVCTERPKLPPGDWGFALVEPRFESAVSEDGGLTRRDWAHYMDCADRRGLGSGADVKTRHGELWCAYEPRTPWIDVANGSTGGFKGRNAGLVRVNGANAVGDDTDKAWRAKAWRNERVYAQFVVWSDCDMGDLRLAATDLTGEGGAKIPSSSLKPRFLRHTLARKTDMSGIVRSVPETLEGDCLDDSERVRMAAFTYRPVWLVVEVPRDAAKGAYRGTLSVVADKARRIDFPLELTVLDETLPDPKDWAFFLDLWQHPWAVARYHGVKPFSPAHYELMAPLMRELANGGQKTITTTLTDLPWNHQNYDAYETMVRHVKGADGSWTHDYSVFDSWVSFADGCGLGPQIHCYTMATWGNIVYYTDGETGDNVSVELKAGTPEHEAFWGAFLGDFERHLAEKGWLGRTYIALDERSREELTAAADIIKRYGPRLKLQMAGNKKPSEFAGITVDNYSQSMNLDWITPEYRREVSVRRAAGHTTTFYVCCSPAQPNSFTSSPFAEQQSLGVYAVAQGFDGMLRWAAFNWPRDPFFDSSFRNWMAGDTYLLYPGGRTSARWEMLRDGIELNEKIRALRAAGRATLELEAAIAGLDLGVYRSGKEGDFRKLVDGIAARVDEASRR